MAQYLAAPMEGVTGLVWRRAHRQIFGGADLYYAPFVSPDQNLHFQTKELRELSGGEQDLVPQILTNRSDLFIWAAKELRHMGFGEINLNTGCPSGTVVAKHKGSGMLRDAEWLDHFFEDVFTALPDVPISVKTRIGIRDTEEWESLRHVFEKYPFRRLIVHPRLQREFYTGSARREVFQALSEVSSLPLVYNGDIRRADDSAFSFGTDVMVGRGLTQNPSLFREVRGGKKASREELSAFHEQVLNGYASVLPGQTAVLYRMLEFWHYFIDAFSGAEPLFKKMTKSKTLSAYQEYAGEILRDLPLAEV